METSFWLFGPTRTCIHACIHVHIRAHMYKHMLASLVPSCATLDLVSTVQARGKFWSSIALYKLLDSFLSAETLEHTRTCTHSMPHTCIYMHTYQYNIQCTCACMPCSIWYHMTRAWNQSSLHRSVSIRGRDSFDCLLISILHQFRLGPINRASQEIVAIYIESQHLMYILPAMHYHIHDYMYVHVHVQSSVALVVL